MILSKKVLISIFFIFSALVLIICAILIFRNSPVQPAQIFEEKTESPPGKFEEIKPKTILLLGDIMLDRSVEQLMEENGVSYPFEKINDFLREMDIVFGNLEGPIVKKPKEFPRSSLKFAFSFEVIDTLSSSGFDLFSLANNHTLNMGQLGLEETKANLKQADINFVGDPLKCTKEFLYQKDNLVFLAFNKTLFSTCPEEEIITAIQGVKSSNPDHFFIVSVHWGEEYKLKNSTFQRDLAHKMIDHGADLIVGHHPHVVQNIEVYKNKLIFYSLGNFVFDQYFSQETQEGLAIKLEIFPERFIYKIFPLQSELSQPFLMQEMKAKEFLRQLSQRSSLELLEQIKNGIIEIEKHD